MDLYTRAGRGPRLKPAPGLAQVLLGPAVGLAAVSRGVHQVELAIEMHVDLAAVGLLHLDLVIALFIADLGGGDLAPAGVLEGGRLRPVERGAGDRRLAAVVAAPVAPAIAAPPAPSATIAPPVISAAFALLMPLSLLIIVYLQSSSAWVADGRRA